jgi:hypothetical protein
MESTVTGMADGMQKRGMARQIQAGKFNVSCFSGHVIFFVFVTRSFRLTNRDDIGDGSANGSEVERRADEIFAAAEERDSNGHDVAQVEEDDTDTVEGVESSVRAEPDQAEGGLDDKAADHAVERHAETDVDLLEPVRARHGVIASKGPDATGSSGGASSATEDAEKDEWDREDERADFAADCRTENDGHGLSVGVVEEGVDVREDKGQGNEEDESDDKVHDGGAEHGLGDLRRGRLDFLGHGDDHSSG